MIRSATIILGAALFLLTACGVKGALQPKGQPEPLPPSGMVLKQQGYEILMSWESPTNNQDGTALTDLAGFRIDLYSYQSDRYCPECRDQETITTIKPENPAPAIRLGKSLFYRTGPLDIDYGYRYRIVPYTKSGKSGPPVETRRIILQPPAAPDAIKAEELDRGARLFWKLPVSVQETGEILGVNLYRGEIGSVLNPVPINREPVAGNNFDDFGLENGKTYQYGLRTVIASNKTIVESELGQIIEVSPRAGL